VPSIIPTRRACKPRSRALRNGSKRCSAKNGGWGAFDVDNDQDWLNRVPYGDLKAMIDPATADVSARVLEMVERCNLTVFDRTRSNAASTIC